LPAARIARGRVAALTGRCRAAVALAGAALLAAAALLASAHARTALLARAAGSRLHVLILRELDATGCGVGRNWGGDSDGCRGPEDHCEYSHSLTPEEDPPRETIRLRWFGFRCRQKLSMNGRSSRAAARWNKNP
jgi:hypothetical protein